MCCEASDVDKEKLVLDGSEYVSSYFPFKDQPKGTPLSDIRDMLLCERGSPFNPPLPRAS